MHLGLANRITLGRGIATLVVWALLAIGAHHPSSTLWTVAFVLFVITAVGDVFDGMIARRLGEVTVFGRILDPLVDKYLTMGSMILLLGVPTSQPWLPTWMVAVIFAREMLVTTLRSAVEATGRSFQAVRIGKFKMMTQCIAVGGVMTIPLQWGWAHLPIPALDGAPILIAPWSLTHVAVWVATILTAWSGFVYVARAIRLLSDVSDDATA